MSRERWGTFSVKDHLQPRAFVADILLYDRLVIPYPPTAEERLKWSGLGWKPQSLDAKLEILGDEMVMRVPWNTFAQDRYKTRMAAAKDVISDAVNTQLAGDAYHATRMILADDCKPPLPKGVAKAWTFAAYPSFDAYQQDAKDETDDEKRTRLSAVLSHKFLVPETAGKSDDEMLRQAVELARRDDFKEKRSAFQRWQDDIIKEEIPPEKAIEEMEQYLKQYNQVVMKASHEMRWKFAFLVLKTAFDLLGAGLGAPAAIASASVDFLSFAKFDRKPKIEADESETAAMIHDVQRTMAWT